MAYEASVLRRAARRLEEAREDRARELERRRAEITAPAPGGGDRQAAAGDHFADHFSLPAGGPGPGPAIGVIRDRNLDLQAERTALLTGAGYPADALDERPACPKCKDTGWIGVEMCTCLKTLCAQEQIRELSKLLELGEQSFDAFSLDYYNAQAWPGRPNSPGEHGVYL